MKSPPKPRHPGHFGSGIHTFFQAVSGGLMAAVAADQAPAAANALRD